MPDPVVLVIGGAVLGFVLGLPQVELDPDVALVAFLPPLLYGAGIYANFQDFRSDQRWLMLNAVPLVLATVCAVALAAHTLVPEMPWRRLSFSGRSSRRQTRSPPARSCGITTAASYDPGESYANGCAAAMVEVDVDTGSVTIEQLVVEDCGVQLNPMIVRGQVAGAVAMGIGIALLEDLAYDPDGEFISGSLLHYLFPTTGEVPVLDLHSIETPSNASAGGVKAVGEAGTTRPPPPSSMPSPTPSARSAPPSTGSRHPDLPARDPQGAGLRASIPAAPSRTASSRCEGGAPKLARR